MSISPDMIQKIEDIVGAALPKIGAADIGKKVQLAVKFARCQPPVEVTLDGAKVVGVAVDIASVFSPQGNYRPYTDEQGVVKTVEAVQALSIVLVENNVRLCKSTYDVILGATPEEEQFINVMYWTTEVDMLTENYIC